MLDGGHHSDDHNRWRVSSNNVPRERILQTVREKDLSRPASDIKNNYGQLKISDSP